MNSIDAEGVKCFPDALQSSALPLPRSKAAGRSVLCSALPLPRNKAAGRSVLCSAAAPEQGSRALCPLLCVATPSGSCVLNCCHHVQKTLPQG